MLEKFHLLNELLKSSVDESTDDLTFISRDLEGHTGLLEELGVKYESHAEGISLELYSKDILIFKKKSHAVERLSLNAINKYILIIENNIVYNPSSAEHKVFFDNVFYWHRLFDLFIENSIATFDDSLKKKLIFLSEKNGKIEVGYRIRWNESFYDNDNKLKETYQKLDSLIKCNSEFGSFYRDNFVKISQDIPEVDQRFTQSLKLISHIFELAKKDFDLFKSKFSFENFRTEFDKENEKHFKDYQSTITDFLSKVSTLPIQFGAYIVLLLKFIENPLPLIVTLFLIIFWSGYNFIAVKQLLNNLKHTEKLFNGTYDNLAKKAIVNESDIAEGRTSVQEKIDSTKFMLISFNWLVVVFTLVFLVYGIFILSGLYCSSLIP